MAHVDNLRRHFPAVRPGAYLNTGAYGALPDTTIDAMVKSLREQLTEGRYLDDYQGRLHAVQEKVRAQLSHLFSVPAPSLALTDSATHGMNIAVNGLQLNPGDEVIVTNTAHPRGLLPIFRQKQRRGVLVHTVDGTLPPDVICQTVEQLMSPRTRLLLCSQVSFSTGSRLPIERLAKIVHAHHAYIIVDGSQGAGAEAINLTESDIDFYALPGQKWLCGPDGVGALYVKPELLSVLDLTYVGLASLADAATYNLSGSFLTTGTASQYEHARVSLCNWTGWLESLQFLRVEAGWDYVYTRIQGLSGELIDKLLDIDDVRILTPRECRAGLVHFQMRDVDSQKFVKAAKERSLYVASIPARQAVRVSAGFYNTSDELERLLKFVQNVRNL